MSCLSTRALVIKFLIFEQMSMVFGSHCSQIFVSPTETQHWFVSFFKQSLLLRDKCGSLEQDVLMGHNLPVVP